MTVATKPQPLGELYLSTLAEDSSYYSLSGTIALAITSASHPVDAAAIFARHAMGTLEHCISLISDDQLSYDSEVWARIDAFFDNAPINPVELACVIKELRQQSYRVLEKWEEYAVEQNKTAARSGFERHGLWLAELYGAGHLLQAASKVLSESQNA